MTSLMTLQAIIGPRSICLQQRFPLWHVGSRTYACFRRMNYISCHTSKRILDHDCRLSIEEIPIVWLQCVLCCNQHDGLDGQVAHLCKLQDKITTFVRTDYSTGCAVHATDLFSKTQRVASRSEVASQKHGNTASKRSVYLPKQSMNFHVVWGER